MKQTIDGRTVVDMVSQLEYDTVYAARGWVSATQSEYDTFVGATILDDYPITKAQLDAALAGFTPSSATSVHYPDGTTTATVVDRPGSVVNVLDYGAVGDGRRRYDGVIASGSKGTLTSATGTFTNADVGKLIAISGAGTQLGFATTETHVTTIAAVVSATSVTLTTPAVRAVSAATYTYGTDNATALTNTVNATVASALCRTMYIPRGMFLTSAVLPSLNNSVDFTLRGAGGRMGAGTTSKFNNRGSLVGPDTNGIMVEALTEVCYIGTTTSNFVSADDAIGLSIEDISLRYHTAGFTGSLVRCGSSVLWGYLSTMTNVQLAGVDQTTVNATACLDLAGGSSGGGIEFIATNCTFQNAQRCIRGQSNQFTMTGGHIADFVVGGVVNPGTQWSFYGVVFENGIQGGGKSNPVILSASGQGKGESLTLDGCAFWDQFGTAATVIDYYGNNISITGTLFYLVGSGTILKFNNDATPKGLTFTGNDLAPTTSTSTWALFSLPQGIQNYNVRNNNYNPAVITNTLPAPTIVPAAPVRSGYYVPAVPAMQSAGASGRALSGGFQGYGECWPFAVSVHCVTTNIALEIVGAGASGSDYRLGLYADTGSFYPGAKIIDFGTVTGSATGVFNFTVSQALNADTIYWLMLVAQGTGAQPTVRSSVGAVDLGRLAASLTAESTNPNAVLYVQGIAAGALPSTAPAAMDGNNQGTVPRVLLKVA